MGYKNPNGAYVWAQRYQKKHNLPKMPSRLTIGELAYQLRAEGMDWIDIAEDLNYRPEKRDNERVNYLKSLAKRYGEKNEGKL